MDLIADRGRRVSVDELNTTQLLRHARKQAVQRNLDDMLIVDVDAQFAFRQILDVADRRFYDEVVAQVFIDRACLRRRFDNHQGL